MIFLDSRYADGILLQTWHAGKSEYHLVVTRELPNYILPYFIYVSVQGDRLDKLASKYLGNSSMWWKILDINPEIVNPQDINPGTQLRIPHA